MDRYAFYAYINQWPDIIAMLSKAEPHLRRIGRPAAANLLLRAYGELRDDLNQLGSDQAVAGTVTLREIEKRTRVRPDTQGGGGPRLGDFLVAERIGGALLPGSIGIANLDLLDANVPWWVTNEVGSSALVGHRIFGTFYGQNDAGPPEPGPGGRQNREHPLFQPGRTGPLAGRGTIENPIPARHFIERSVKLIDERWRREFEAIRARYEARLDVVAATRR